VADWALLPGTIVSEMAYIFGCLITGGEVRRAKLMDDSDGRRGGADGESGGTQTTGGLKVVGPVVASLLAIVACGAGILAAWSLLGKPVIDEFTLTGEALRTSQLPQELPAGWDALWGQLDQQVHLLRGMCETWGELDWLRWRVPLFVYLSLCLSIRLAPLRRPARPTLAAAVVIAGVIAAIGAVSSRFKDVIGDLWPLLTYVWALLLFVLVAALLVRGLIALGRILAGKAG